MLLEETAVPLKVTKNKDTSEAMVLDFVGVFVQLSFRDNVASF